jgi:hypothetical protein
MTGNFIYICARHFLAIGIIMLGASCSHTHVNGVRTYTVAIHDYLVLSPTELAAREGIRPAFINPDTDYVQGGSNWYNTDRENWHRVDCHGIVMRCIVGERVEAQAFHNGVFRKYSFLLHGASVDLSIDKQSAGGDTERIAMTNSPIFRGSAIGVYDSDATERHITVRLTRDEERDSRVVR